MPPHRPPFAPVATCEPALFATLRRKEAVAQASPTPHQGRRPSRLGLIRGEVALLAERVLLVRRHGA